MIVGSRFHILKETKREIRFYPYPSELHSPRPFSLVFSKVVKDRTATKGIKLKLGSVVEEIPEYTEEEELGVESVRVHLCVYVNCC